MRVMRPHADRLRRTEAVIEILRRRAALRDARREPIPPALKRAIDEYDRQPPVRRAGPR